MSVAQGPGVRGRGEIGRRWRSRCSGIDSDGEDTRGSDIIPGDIRRLGGEAVDALAQNAGRNAPIASGIGGGRPQECRSPGHLDGRPGLRSAGEQQRRIARNVVSRHTAVARKRGDRRLAGVGVDHNRDQVRLAAKTELPGFDLEVVLPVLEFRCLENLFARQVGLRRANLLTEVVVDDDPRPCLRRAD